jgi:hypothetical protein
MTCVYRCRNFDCYYFAIYNFCSKQWVMRTHVHSLQRPNFEEKPSDTWINTHLQKCSEQGTPERLPCSRLVTWFRSKTKEICNKVCRWLFPNSTSLRATTEKVSNPLEIYIQGFLTLKNKVIKLFHKTPLIKFRAVGQVYPAFEFPPFYGMIGLFPNFLRGCGQFRYKQ